MGTLSLSLVWLTQLVEAAKIRPTAILHSGVRSFSLKVACPGYGTAHDNAIRCSGEHHAIASLRVPDLYDADVEVVFPPYRLDAVATQDGSIVLALEVQ